MILAWDQALTRMRATCLTAVHEVLDNKCSALYKKSITDSGITCEQVPLDNHQHNLAKRAIQTWKAHFITVLSGISKEFPVHL